MAQFIKEKLDIECVLISGEVGEFSIYFHQEKLIAKGDVGCEHGFPTREEVIQKLREKQKHG